MRRAGVDGRPASELEALDRRCVRLRRRLEARDRALEQQLVAGVVLETEVDVSARCGPEVCAAVARARDLLKALEALAAPLPEEGVVERVLGVEVGVQGLGPHPDFLGHPLEADAN